MVGKILALCAFDVREACGACVADRGCSYSAEARREAALAARRELDAMLLELRTARKVVEAAREFGEGPALDDALDAYDEVTHDQRTATSFDLRARDPRNRNRFARRRMAQALKGK